MSDPKQPVLAPGTSFPLSNPLFTIFYLHLIYTYHTAPASARRRKSLRRKRQAHPALPVTAKPARTTTNSPSNPTPPSAKSPAAATRRPRAGLTWTRLPQAAIRFDATFCRAFPLSGCVGWVIGGRDLGAFETPGFVLVGVAGG
ncbi:hypothetical protein B0T25DRAFT_515548 [Lasiosphaeria hispida]|uniref:Uncharacterized protein n=1 Tax=Lasiosphaeria hispida TaxID=260671 RepID=A0AAJ0HRW4_9PEZI|nr:hypothetical protein B0T25DRAFT_515548 [Lasiosphaeria hispida]